jgi:RNA polymerase sigma-70 factor (ECF subfamily)
LASDQTELLFRQVLSEHGGIVARVSRAYSANVDDRQDLAQDILLHVWRSLPDFAGRSKLSTWVYRVALNTAIRWQEREHRRQQHHKASLFPNAVLATGPDGPDRMAQSELVERLSTAIRSLPTTDSALVLLHLEGLPHAEIADVLGISAVHVGVKLHRAKAALAAQLQEFRDER